MMTKTTDQQHHQERSTSSPSTAAAAAPVPREGPAWVDSFLAGEYFSNCNFHTSGKNERNQFCTDCNEGPLCQFGLLQSHSGHRTLQVRKASHMDSIRVVDIEQCLEVSDIQTYSINSARIVFLLSRPQPRPSKGAPHACLCCNRPLSDDMKFCSLACKLDVLRDVPGDMSITFAMPERSPGDDSREQQQVQSPDNTGKPQTGASIHEGLQQQFQQMPKKGKKKRLGKRRKWTEKKGFKKKKLLLPKKINKILFQDTGLTDYLKHAGNVHDASEMIFRDSPATPEKSESPSSKSRCRKGVPRRAPMR